MDKKHLLVAASALVVGLSFGNYAYAHDGSSGGGGKGSQVSSTAVAASFQAGEVE